jgi:hypothetical protein
MAMAKAMAMAMAMAMAIPLFAATSAWSFALRDPPSE